MLTECCFKGFEWSGTPVGTESTLANLPTYVTGTHKEVAIFYIADIFGWRFPNNRLLADHLAKEADATVYVPDFYDGHEMPAEPIKAGRFDQIDIQGFMKRNAPAVKEPALFECAKALRAQYKRVVAVGYCYGGWASFRLGAKDVKLVDAISIAHPSMVTHEHINNISVPVQLLIPETDVAFPKAMEAYANHVIPTLGVPYNYISFPGMTHGFATRGNDTDGEEGKAMTRSKNAQVYWCKQWLHGAGI